MTDLRKAAQAVIDRWHTPNWAHDSVHTGVLIDALSKALTAHQEQSGWVGLTDDEIALIGADYCQQQGFAKAIESALRAKNAVPERVPMTDAEQTALYLLAICKLKTVPTYSDIIRAAEAHHGIKEQK